MKNTKKKKKLRVLNLKCFFMLLNFVLNLNFMKFTKVSTIKVHKDNIQENVYDDLEFQ